MTMMALFEKIPPLLSKEEAAASISASSWSLMGTGLGRGSALALGGGTMAVGGGPAAAAGGPAGRAGAGWASTGCTPDDAGAGRLGVATAASLTGDAPALGCAEGDDAPGRGTVARAPEALGLSAPAGFAAPGFAAGFSPSRAFKSERSGLLLFVDKSVPPAFLSECSPGTYRKALLARRCPRAGGVFRGGVNLCLS